MVNANNTRTVCCPPLKTRIACPDCKATMTRNRMPARCPHCRGENLETERRMYRVEAHVDGRVEPVGLFESVTTLQVNERCIAESWDGADQCCVECCSFSDECFCGSDQAEELPVPQLKAIAYAIRQALGAGNIGKAMNALNAMDRLLECTPLAAPVEADEFSRAMCHA